MAEIFNPALIESVLSTVFDYFKKKVITTPSHRANFDFVLEEEKFGKTAIEIKSQHLNFDNFRRIVYSLDKNKDIKNFILITPVSPKENDLRRFDKHLKSRFKNSNWFGFQDYLKQFYGLDVKTSDDLVQLQIAAITSKYDTYNKEFIGNKFLEKRDIELLQTHFKDVKTGKSSAYDNLISLRRQFPDSILANLDKDYEKILEQLHVGKKYNDAIIVLTDIKNFSSIVSSADADELNEAMKKYYTSARDLVFKYNGILVQFVGDAVLAIFNYPQKNVTSYLNTVKFCSELILLGRATFDTLLSKMDQAIDTGTRIGVSTGTIYTLNIGIEGIELTFIGDKINFAARLEKNCNIDGILLSNRFYNMFSDGYPELSKSIDFIKKELTPVEAKGQASVTLAWQIDYKDIQRIVSFQPNIVNNSNQLNTKK